MQIIAVVGSKGGGGKTTVAANLALHADRAEKKVIVADLDPQQSLAAWLSRRPEDADGISIVGERESKNVESAVSLAKEHNFDILIVDGGPASLGWTEEIIKAADVAVVPVRASALDLEATTDVIALLREAGKPFLVVINAPQTPALANNAIDFFEANKIPVAETVIPARTSYIEAMTRGHAAVETNRDAAREIAALWAEIEKALAPKPSRRTITTGKGRRR